MFNLDYLIAALIIFAMNVVPAFMPPTWILLALFHISYHLAITPLVIIGASYATFGSMILYFFAVKLSWLYSKKSVYFSTYSGKYIKKNKQFSVPLFLLNGITNSFKSIINHCRFGSLGYCIFFNNIFLMRLLTYTFWINGTKVLSTNVEGIFRTEYTDS